MPNHNHRTKARKIFLTIVEELYRMSERVGRAAEKGAGAKPFLCEWLDKQAELERLTA
jgi:hypothetical protein